MPEPIVMVVTTKRELAAAIGCCTPGVESDVVIEWHRTTGITKYTLHPNRLTKVRRVSSEKSHVKVGQSLEDLRYRVEIQNRLDKMQRRASSTLNRNCL